MLVIKPSHLGLWGTLKVQIAACEPLLMGCSFSSISRVTCVGCCVFSCSVLLGYHEQLTLPLQDAMEVTLSEVTCENAGVVQITAVC